MGRPLNDRMLVARLLVRFVRARWGYRFADRRRFDRWQRRRMRSFLTRARRAPFYAGLRATQFPVVDKGVLLDHFADLNTRGIRLADALAVGLAAERSRDFTPTIADDLTVGLSSGTSGRRGAFLVSPRERMLWAGTVLARVLDREAVGRLIRPWRAPLTIAFFLRAGGGLYESVASSRVRFDYFDLTEPFDDLADRFSRLGDVDVLVAPASVLDALARQELARQELARQALAQQELARQELAHDESLGRSGAPRIVVSVAEVLEPETAGRVEAAWGVRPRQVYQATEGLLALPCDAGALHLNEESVRFDREWLDDEHTRFVPIVTDFERRTQIIARYRLDDVVRIDPEAPERCRCGRVTTVVTAIDGRADAVLRLPAPDGSRVVEVFPDLVRRAMALESDAFADWRIRQRELDVHVALADPAPDARSRVESALTGLFGSAGCHAAIVHAPWTAPDPAAKVRRIVRDTP